MPIRPISGGKALGYKFSVEAQYLLIRRLVDKVLFIYAIEALATKAF